MHDTVAVKEVHSAENLPNDVLWRDTKNKITNGVDEKFNLLADNGTFRLEQRLVFFKGLFE